MGYGNSHFADVPRVQNPRSRFDRSHSVTTAFDSGYLIPIFCDDVLPGDTFDLSVSTLARLTTPLLPVMDRIHIDTFFFFVPNRLVWDKWKAFCGENETGDPTDLPDILEPQVDLTQLDDGVVPVGSVYDFAGVPPLVQIPKADCPSALPFRAMKLIYNEWFRDQNVEAPLTVPKGNGFDNADAYTLYRRYKRHDYFTSSLPTPQRGSGVIVPLGSDAPVYTKSTPHDSEFTTLHWTGTSGVYNSGTAGLNTYVGIGTNGKTFSGGPAVSTGEAADWQPKKPADSVYGDTYVGQDIAPDNLYADLRNASSISINDLRAAFATQRILEALNRGGSRYTEQLEGIWNVHAPDQSLQRPEFLGGSSDYIALQQVPQTSSTDATTPQGHLAAFGYANNQRTGGFTKSFVEHGWIIGFVNVWVDLTYQQGLPRNMSRRSRWDYYYPQFANIGEQAVFNKEIYLSNSEVENNKAFGYQERSAEYRYKPSQITGKMRSVAPDSLDAWHLAQYFENQPTLNKTFLQENPPLDRILAVSDEPEIYLNAYFDLKCTRQMPVYSVPGMGVRL